MGRRGAAYSRPLGERHASKAYRAFALVCARGTGKNTGVKREKGGPFEASTAEAAMALRDQWICDYLPPRRPSVQSKMGAPARARVLA